MCCLIPALVCRVLGVACLIAGVLIGALVLLHHDRSMRETVNDINDTAQKVFPAIGEDRGLVDDAQHDELLGKAGGARCTPSWHYLLATEDGRIVASASIHQTHGYTFELTLAANRWSIVSMDLSVNTDSEGQQLFTFLDDWNTDAGPLVVIVDHYAGTIGYRLPRRTDIRLPVQWNSRPGQMNWSPCYGSTIVFAIKARVCNPNNPRSCHLATLGPTVVSEERAVALHPCCVGACCKARRCLADWVMEDDCATDTTAFSPDVACKPSTCAIRPS